MVQGFGVESGISINTQERDLYLSSTYKKGGNNKKDNGEVVQDIVCDTRVHSGRVASIWRVSNAKQVNTCSQPVGWAAGNAPNVGTHTLGWLSPNVGLPGQPSRNWIAAGEVVGTRTHSRLRSRTVTIYWSRMGIEAEMREARPLGTSMRNMRGMDMKTRVIPRRVCQRKHPTCGGKMYVRMDRRGCSCWVLWETR